MKRIIIAAFLILTITGCGAVRFGTYIDTKIMPYYQVSAERIKTIAPLFKDNWAFISGFIQGNTYWELKAPVVLQNVVMRLDIIYVKAKNDTWTDKEKGEMASLVLQLEYEWGKYLYDTYGDTMMNLVRQVAGG